MLIVDLIAGAFLVGMVAWGVRAGVLGTIVLACFAAGAVVGALLAPAVLTGGQESDFALAVAFPAALLAGALLAALVERRVGRLRLRLVRVRTPSAIGGAVLAAWTGVVALWLVAAAAAQVAALRDRIDDATITGSLNSVLGALGPAETAPTRVIDPFPVVAGPGPPISPVDLNGVHDADVRAADASVVRIAVDACGRFGVGSGWVGGDATVVTNAHVVANARTITVRVRGKGPRLPARPIWFDRVNDVALLRVPALRGVRALSIPRAPREGASGAAIGFPGGFHAIRAARMGPSTDSMPGQMSHVPRGFPRDLSGRLVTTYRARTQPGSSGGPIVDMRGRVLTTVFGGRVTRQSGLGVPNQIVRSALRRAGPEVDTGSCADASATSAGR
jgi:S1-C subfamily serine protease